MAKAARARDLDIRPLTPARADDVKAITASTWGSQCWDLWWRFTKPLSEVFRDSSLPDVAEAASSKEKTMGDPNPRPPLTTVVPGDASAGRVLITAAAHDRIVRHPGYLGRTVCVRKALAEFD